MKRKWPRCLVISLLVLGTLIALFYAEENWRGAHAWKQVEDDLRAKGEPLTLAEMEPAPVPDGENVAMAPVFQEIFIYDSATKEAGKNQEKPSPPRVYRVKEIIKQLISKTDMLPSYSLGRSSGIKDYSVLVDFIAKEQLFLSEMRGALDRPEINWKQDYKQGFSLSIPHIGAALDLGKYYQLEALADMKRGKAGEALEVIRYTQRLSQVVRKDAFVIGNLVGITVDEINANTIWEGFQRRVWNEKQLLQLQALSREKSDEFSDYQVAMRWERMAFLQATQEDPEKMVAMITSWTEDKESFNWEKLMAKGYFVLRPKGWSDLDRTRYTGWLQKSIELGEGFKRGTSGLDDFQKIDDEVVSKKRDMKQSLITPMTFLALPAMSGIIKKTVEAENRNRMVQTACALERYRLSEGKVPATLDVLIPGYLSAVPIDIVDGKPLRYIVKNEQDYLIYSVGLNQQDDGGYTAKDKKGGDWVWASKPGLVEVRDK